MRKSSLRKVKLLALNSLVSELLRLQSQDSKSLRIDRTEAWIFGVEAGQGGQVGWATPHPLEVEISAS